MRMIDYDEVGLKNSQKIHNCFIWNGTFRNEQGRYSILRLDNIAWYSDNMDDNHVHVLSKNTLIATLARDMHLKAAK